jgi:hypothetical protein
LAVRLSFVVSFRQHFPVFPPHNALFAAAAPTSLIVADLCHNGGCSRAFRRFLLLKILNSAAVPVFAAAHFGDNLADFDTNRSYNLIENL